MKKSKVRLALVAALVLAASRIGAQPAPGAGQAAQGNPPALHGLESSPARELTPPKGPESRLPRPESLTSFDPATVELSWREGRWSLTAAGKPFKDFGRREEEARQAWHLIRELHLNQRGTVGAPRPVLEYWLADGQPPHWLPRGVRVLPLNLAALRVEQMQGNWVVREPGRPLFTFGSHRQEAEQALAVLRKYGFNQVGVVGRATAAMQLFVARPEDGGPAQTVTDPSFKRRTTLLKPVASTDEGRQQAEALARALRKGSPPPAAFPVVPALPLLQPDAQAAAGRPRDLPDVATRRVPFDWRQVQVRRDNGDWKLAAGSHVLANFGRNEHDARLAHAAVAHYRCTEQQLVGMPEPVVSYFLTGGQAPLGVMVGLFSEPFQPDTVALRQVGQHFCLAQGSHPILDCGTRADEGRYIIGVIRQYRFDRLCRIGSDDQHALTFLVRSH